MIGDVFFGLVLAVIILSDVVIWLRVLRAPSKKPADQLFGAIIFLLVAVIWIGIWILMIGGKRHAHTLSATCCSLGGS